MRLNLTDVNQLDSERLAPGQLPRRHAAVSAASDLDRTGGRTDRQRSIRVRPRQSPVGHPVQGEDQQVHSRVIPLASQPSRMVGDIRGLSRPCVPRRDRTQERPDLSVPRHNKGGILVWCGRLMHRSAPPRAPNTVRPGLIAHYSSAVLADQHFLAPFLILDPGKHQAHPCFFNAVLPGTRHIEAKQRRHPGFFRVQEKYFGLPCK